MKKEIRRSRPKDLQLGREKEIRGINERVGHPNLASAIRIKMASYDSRFIERGETTPSFFASLSHYCTFD